MAETAQTGEAELAIYLGGKIADNLVGAAANVHWVIAGEDQVEDGIKQALSRVKSAGVIVEGNSFLDFIEADFAFMCARAGENRIKSSARRNLQKADALYVSTIDNCDGASARRRFDEWGKSLSINTNPNELQVFTREDLSDLVRIVQTATEKSIVTSAA